MPSMKGSKSKSEKTKPVMKPKKPARSTKTAKPEPPATTVNDLLGQALFLEQHGQSIYQKMSETAKDPKAKSLFTFLANQEIEHAQFITEELQKRNVPVPSSGTTKMLPSTKQVFHFKFVSPDDDPVAATKLAIKLEERSIQLYKDGSKLARGPTKEMFLRLVNFENDHKTLLEENLDQLEEEGSWIGYHPMLEG